MINLYETEQILIAIAFRWFEFRNFVLPELTPDKFIYGVKGDFGGMEHREIWKWVYDCVVNKSERPTLIQLPFYTDYVSQLIQDLDNKYYVYEFDPNLVQQYARVIDKAGVVYNVSRTLGKTHTISASEETFFKQVQSIDSLENWLSDLYSKINTVYRTDKRHGYRSMSEIVTDVEHEWDRMYSGEQMSILPVGLPVFESHQLFPLNTFSVLHGLSGSGKSALGLQILIGTALGLVLNDLPGCVAFNSLEMSDKSLVSRASSMLAGIDWSRLRGGKEPLTEEEFLRLKEWLHFTSKIPLYIDSTSLITTDEVNYNTTSLYSGEHGPVWQLLTDYIELFGDDEGESREQDVSYVARNQKHISRTLNMSVIGVSQSTPSSKTKVAAYDELRYSRAITHAADIVFLVMNYPAMDRAQMEYKPLQDNTGFELDTNTAWIIVQKYRDGGMTGAFPLGWEGEFTRFFDLDLKDSNHNMLLFEHFREIDKLKEKMGTEIVSINDTPLAGWS